MDWYKLSQQKNELGFAVDGFEASMSNIMMVFKYLVDYLDKPLSFAESFKLRESLLKYNHIISSSRLLLEKINDMGVDDAQRNRVNSLTQQYSFYEKYLQTFEDAYRSELPLDDINISKLMPLHTIPMEDRSEYLNYLYEVLFEEEKDLAREMETAFYLDTPDNWVEFMSDISNRIEAVKSAIHTFPSDFLGSNKQEMLSSLLNDVINSYQRLSEEVDNTLPIAMSFPIVSKFSDEINNGE